MGHPFLVVLDEIDPSSIDNSIRIDWNQTFFQSDTDRRCFEKPVSEYIYAVAVMQFQQSVGVTRTTSSASESSLPHASSGQYNRLQGGCINGTCPPKVHQKLESQVALNQHLLYIHDQTPRGAPWREKPRHRK